MHLVNQIERMQKVGFAGSGCTTALIDSAYHSGFTQDDRAPGECSVVVRMAYFDAGDIC
jgi:hypothetical protein